MANVASSDPVSLAELLEFVRPRHHAILVTTRGDGRPQLSPVSAGVDPQGRIVISTYPQRAKTRNAQRVPQVSVCVLSDRWDDAWVQVDGDCEVLDASPDADTASAAADAFVDYYRSIAGEHPDWDAYRAAMITQGKALLRITPTRWGPVATGGFPPEVAARMG